MKLLLSFSILLLILLGCKPVNDPVKKKPKETYEVKDTELAEIREDRPVKFSTKDSLVAQKFWTQFRELLGSNDKAAIVSLSLKEVFCPVYRDDWNYFTGNRPVSIYFFLHAPFTNNYVAAFSSYLAKDTPKISLDRSSENEITCTVSYETTEHFRNYKIFRTHNFNFTTLNDSLKFAGLTVEENGTWTERKLTNSHSLYFPLAHEKWDAITDPESLDTFANMWYSQALVSFNETILYNNRSEDEIYRFTWLRSFNNPIVIKFVHHNSDFILTTKELVDFHGYRAVK